MVLRGVANMDKKPGTDAPKAKVIVYRTNKKSRRIDTVALQSALSDIESATHLSREDIERQLLAGKLFEDAWSTYHIKRV